MSMVQVILIESYYINPMSHPSASVMLTSQNHFIILQYSLAPLSPLHSQSSRLSRPNIDSGAKLWISNHRIHRYRINLYKPIFMSSSVLLHARSHTHTDLMPNADKCAGNFFGLMFFVMFGVWFTRKCLAIESALVIVVWSIASIVCPRASLYLFISSTVSLPFFGSLAPSRAIISTRIRYPSTWPIPTERICVT